MGQTYQRSDVTLDSTRSQTNDEDSDNEASQSSTILKSHRDRSADQNEQTDQVDNTEKDDGLVFAEVLIGDDGTQNGGH